MVPHTPGLFMVQTMIDQVHTTSIAAAALAGNHQSVRPTTLRELDTFQVALGQGSPSMVPQGLNMGVLGISSQEQNASEASWSNLIHVSSLGSPLCNDQACSPVMSIATGCSGPW